MANLLVAGDPPGPWPWPVPQTPDGWPEPEPDSTQTICDHPCEAYFVDGSCACTGGQSRFTEDEESEATV